MKLTTSDQLVSFREPSKGRSSFDPLLLAIIGTAVGLTLLVVGIAFYGGSGPVIAEIPWIIPMVSTFNSLATICVAFLALGRYQVLRDPVSFWIGIGFASLGIGQVFYVLAWPELLPGGRAIIAQLTNTSAVIADLNLIIFGTFLLAAVLIRWPGKQSLVAQHWLGWVVVWLSVIALIYILLVTFESFLPVLVRANGSFTPLLLAGVTFLLLLFTAGTILSTRYYWRVRDPLTGYIALSQMALVFVTLMAIIGGKRYDLWWYTQRVVLVVSYLIVLFGLLSEYIHLFRRERESQEALQVYARRLERTNRDLQNFTILASHDLQEPLRKIEAFGDAVIEDTANLHEHQRDRILRMRKSAQQMRDMLNGLLQLSLVPTNRQSFEAVDLHQTTIQALSDLDQQIQQTHSVVEVGKLPAIEADPLQMRRLFQNLIENALKFQPPGGEPRIKIYSMSSTPHSVQILVEDNGIGFEEANAEHLFEPFERLVGKNQSRYGGIGIGLAICRSIVEHHGGEIAARSKPGQGTTLIVTLPTRQPDRSTERAGRDLNDGE